MLSYFLNIVIIIAILYGIWKWQASSSLSKVGFLLIALIKIGFAIFSCYYYNPGDIQLFQRDSEVLTSLFYSDFESYKNILLYDEYGINNIRAQLYYWPKPRAFFMAKILSIFNLVSNNNIFVNAIYLSLFNLFSIFVLISKVQKYTKKYTLSVMAILLFVPSVVFNTSGLEKEVLVMSGMYLIISFGFSMYYRNMRLADVLILLLGVFLLFKIKYYYLAVLGPLGVSFLLSHFIAKRWVKYSLASAIVLLLIYYAKYMHPYLHPELAFQSTVHANHDLILRSGLGMNIPYSFENYTLIEFIINLPMALIYGLFGPFAWEFKNAAMFYIGVENLAFLILTLLFLAKLFKKEIAWTYFGTVVLIYVFSLTILLAFYSPNFGTLTRYKVAFLPFMYIFIFRYSISEYLSTTSIVKYLLKKQ